MNVNGLGLGKNYEFGHSYFLRIKEFTKKTIEAKNKVELFRNYLEPVLREYIRGFKEDGEVDGTLKDALKIFTGEDDAKKENKSSDK